MKTVEGIPEIPSPPVTVPGSNEVVIQLPAGYDAGTEIYIDGVPYTSASWSQNTSARLVSVGKQGAKTAVMYQYNASGIPVGMYVWLLEYNGTYYTAQAVPELQDLFSYHGFSVRYTGWKRAVCKCLSWPATEPLCDKLCIPCICGNGTQWYTGCDLWTGNVTQYVYRVQTDIGQRRF